MTSSMKTKDRFFLSITPHFEVQLLQEMREVYPLLLNKAAQPIDHAFPDYELQKGGIEFSDELFVAVQFQYFLKTPHRLLWRTDEFKARDFPTLFNRTKSARLRTLLGGESSCRLKVAASESRLGQEKRIAQTVLDALNLKESETAAYTVYVRVFQDQVQFSLDLSGAHLHFRGYATEKGEAPLRETWASLFMRLMIEDQSLSLLQSRALVDPFAGSGTLLFESALIYTPHFDREFAFNQMAQGPKLFRSESFRKNFRFQPSQTFRKLIGFERDLEIFQKLQSNVHAVQSRFTHLPEVETYHLDSFESSQKVDSPCWIFSNPPYGDRLHSDSNLRSPKDLQNLIENLIRRFHPERIGLVVPQEGIRNSKIKFKGIYEFSNGGIACAFVILDP